MRKKPSEPETLELTTVGAAPVAKRSAAPLSPMAMLQAVIEKGVTSENAAALEKLVGLCEHMEARDAEREFNAAFVRLQSDMPRIQATKPVPNKDGSVRYKFAPFEELMDVVGKVLARHDFSMSFSQRVDNARMTAVCHLYHAAGHTRTSEYSVRIGSGPPGSTETQADGAASTYAKRGALCNALNIVIEKDEDARNLGEPITQAQADDLRRRVHATGADETAFLRYADATTFEAISTTRYADLDSNLRRKENTK